MDVRRLVSLFLLISAWKAKFQTENRRLWYRAMTQILSAPVTLTGYIMVLINTNVISVGKIWSLCNPWSLFAGTLVPFVSKAYLQIVPSISRPEYAECEVLRTEQYCYRKWKNRNSNMSIFMTFQFFAHSITKWKKEWKWQQPIRERGQTLL